MKTINDFSALIRLEADKKQGENFEQLKSNFENLSRISMAGVSSKSDASLALACVTYVVCEILAAETKNEVFERN
jgi:hypothetical protein